MARIFSGTKLINTSSDNFFVGFGSNNMIFNSLGFSLEGLGNVGIGASASSYTDTKVAIVSNYTGDSTYALKIINGVYQDILKLTDSGSLTVQKSIGVGFDTSTLESDVAAAFDGKVGVGTDTPTANLSVQGSITGGESAETLGVNNFTFGVGGQPGDIDTSFAREGGSGANGTVSAIAIQSDGKIVIGGSFTSYAGTTRQRVARLNSDGSLDTTFDSSSGANSTVYALAIQSDGKIVIGGDFTTYDGTTRQRVARLNSDGSLDTSFDTTSGANDYVLVITIQNDQTVLIGGMFTTFAGTTRQRVARINSDGSLDTTFISSSGANDRVYEIVSQSDGKIVIGGWFTSYAGTTRQRVARLNSDGSLDTSFGTTSGADNTVSALAIQSDGKIIIGGDFSSYAGTQRLGIARLNSDGSLDTTFDSSNGTSGMERGVYDIKPLNNGKILFAGSFDEYGGITSDKIAQVNCDGSIDTSFVSSDGASIVIYAIGIQTNGKIIAGGNFTTYGSFSRKYLVRLFGSRTLINTSSDNFLVGFSSSNMVFDDLGFSLEGLSNVGIGVSASTYANSKLSIVSNTTNEDSYALRILNGAYQEIFDVTDDGRVLIGTSTGMQEYNTFEMLSEYEDYGMGIYNSSSLGTSSGGIFGTYTQNIPSAEGQRLGVIRFGGLEFNSTNTYWSGASIEAYSQGAWGASTSQSYLSFLTANNTQTSPVERMRITSTGGVRITSFGAGTVVSDASGNLSVSSDENLKDIKGDFTKGLSEILSLNPILYNWNELSQMEMENTYAGFSAQNVQLVLPEAVGIDSRGFLSLSDRPILAATVNAIKEQQGILTSLSSNISALSGIKINSASLERESIRFNVENKVLEFTNDGITWYQFADNQSLLLLTSRVEELETRIANLNSRESLNTDSNTLNILKVTLNEEGNIELLGGNIIMEGNGTLSIKKLKLEENYSIGSSKILANTTSIVINTKAITTDSKVFINPTSDTLNKVLYVTELKVGESFKVNINGVIPQDITFDWFIIDSKKPLEEIIQPIVKETPVVPEPVIETVPEPVGEPTIPEEIPTEEVVTP